MNTTTTALRQIPLAQILESPLNPRKHFDPAKLADLTASMRTHGQLTPALVRPIPGDQFELAAGHRRFRAAKAAALPALECKVRELTDAQFVEILTIENDEREDVHPLEQAEGYRLLMERAGYDVAKIAARVQRGHDFVYDRLRLLRLTPALRELFLADRFGLSQALVLAKLSPDEQTKAARKPDHRGDDHSGLWRSSGPTLDEKLFPLVAKSAAELEYWIAHELRFDPEKIEIEELFPETAVILEAAEETATRVVSITRDSYVRPNAKDEKDRTYTRDFWKRADGLEGSRECEFAIVGIVRAGEGRGEAFGVCLRRDKCKVHWAVEVKRLEAREKEKKVATHGTPAAKQKAASSRARNEARERAMLLKANIEKSRMVAAAAVLEAELAKLAVAPSQQVLLCARGVLDEEADPAMPLEQLVVRLAIARNFRDLDWALTSYESKRTMKALRDWGLDPVKIIAGVHVETCVHCGCSGENACRLGKWGGGPSCHWVSEKPRVCSNPKCVALSKGQAVPAAAVSDEEDDDEEA